MRKNVVGGVCVLPAQYFSATSGTLFDVSVFITCRNEKRYTHQKRNGYVLNFLYSTGKNVPMCHNVVPDLREQSSSVTVYSLISILEKFQIILTACLETLQ